MAAHAWVALLSTTKEVAKWETACLKPCSFLGCTSPRAEYGLGNVKVPQAEKGGYLRQVWWVFDIYALADPKKRQHPSEAAGAVLGFSTGWTSIKDVMVLSAGSQQRSTFSGAIFLPCSFPKTERATQYLGKVMSSEKTRANQGLETSQDYYIDN